MAEWALHLGDWRERMATFPGGAVDHVITDPPFSEKIHAGARTENHSCAVKPGKMRGANSLIHFDSMDADAFLSFCRECVRVARRWVIMTCDWRHAVAAEQANLPVIRCGIWVREGSAPQFTGDRPGTGWDAVLILHRAGRKRWNGGGHHAVWAHRIERNGLHPTQKPLPLVKDWLRQFTDPGETVLDPCCGVATTGVGCLHTGRRFVGIEIDPNYYAIARKRLEETAEAIDTSLFAEELEEEVSASLFDDEP